MAYTTVNVGTTANDNTGDPIRTAFQTVNANFATLDGLVEDTATITISGNNITGTALLRTTASTFLHHLLQQTTKAFLVTQQATSRGTEVTFIFVTQHGPTGYQLSGAEQHWQHSHNR
jgi:hypothetical protein